jgi:hypothetical protein
MVEGGDRNTKYFHQQAKWRARKNKIRKLQKADESWCENPKEMQDMSRQFLDELYTVDRGVSPDQVLNLIEPKVTQDMNEDCIQFSPRRRYLMRCSKWDPLRHQDRMVFQHGSTRNIGW